MRYSLFTACILTIACLTACGGGGATSENDIKNTTVSKGQALMDLKQAHDSGAMSDSEYNKARDKVLDE